MAIAGTLLKSTATFLIVLEFLASAAVLGIFSYFLAVLADHSLPILKWSEAVEGISGGAAIYTFFGVILTCFVGGIAFFAFLGIVLDLLFLGGFVAIAVLTRGAVKKGSCGNNVSGPFGSGPASMPEPEIGTLETVCKLELAAFAISIGAA